jgi:hypothetical protein
MMSILTTSEVAAFLNIDSNTPGLQAAIEHAEALTAAEMRLDTLEYGEYVEESMYLTYKVQQILTEHGPVHAVSGFYLDDVNRTSEVMVDPSGWAIRWKDPRPEREFDRIRSFEKFSKVSFSYSAGWTNSDGDYPLPKQVCEYIKSLTGLVLSNSFAANPDMVQLGDMTIRYDPKAFENTLKLYMPAISKHARPY